LVGTSPDDELVVKLADFGLACPFESEKPPTQKCGSLTSAAPEMLASKTYSKSVDLWGLGVVLYELLSTELPFYADSDIEYRSNIIH